MLRGRDDAEIRVRFTDWSPPAFRDAIEYLRSLVEPELSVAARELASLEVRVEKGA
jgi:hypothetical protein